MRFAFRFVLLYFLLILSLFVMTLFFSFLANAQTPTKVSVRFDKAKLAWAWTKGTGGDASGFKVKCGGATGAYTLTKQIDDPAVRTILVSQVVASPGTYFCAVFAFNSFGDSGASGEVNFDAGLVPAAPSGTSLVSE